MCFREACETALKEKHLFDSSELEGFLDEIPRSNLEQLEALDRVFRIAAEADLPTDVSTVAPLTFPYPFLFKLNATLFSSRETE